MGRRRAAQRSVGGGGGIPAPRKPRTRLVLAAGSAVTYAAVLAWAAVREPKLAALICGIGAIGAVLLVVVLVRGSEQLLPWCVIPLGIAYTVSLVAHGSSVDGGAALVAVGLLLCTELASWSVQEQQGIAAERAVLVARVTALTLLVLAGLAAAVLVVAFSLVPASGLAWTVLGTAAAVGVVALAVRLAYDAQP